MDAILDAALDELDDSTEIGKSKKNNDKKENSKNDKKNTKQDAINKNTTKTTNATPSSSKDTTATTTATTTTPKNNSNNKKNHGSSTTINKQDEKKQTKNNEEETDALKVLLQEFVNANENDSNAILIGKLMEEAQKEIEEKEKSNCSPNTNNSNGGHLESNKQDTSKKDTTIAEELLSNNNNNNKKVEQSIQELIQGIAEMGSHNQEEEEQQQRQQRQQQHSPKYDPNNEEYDHEEAQDELFQEFLKQMQHGGGEDGGDIFSSLLGSESSATAMMDGMIAQLLSKDLMYEPMKQVTIHFPQWLEQHKSDNDYEMRCKQYSCFKKFVNLYETEPNNTQKLMELMMEIQEYGQPPQEIIQQVAPGLNLDQDGMPNLNDFMMPMVGNNNNDNEECSIM